MHFSVELKGFVGEGAVRAVETSEGTIDADLAVICTKKVPNNALAKAAGLKTRTDRRRGRRQPDGHVRGRGLRGRRLHRDPARGDQCRRAGAHRVSHAYAQGKVAGINAGGGRRDLPAGLHPVGHGGREVDDRRGLLRRDRGQALGIPYVMGQAEGISRARYYPGVQAVKVKLLAEPGSLRLIGAQMVGGEGIKERADFLAMAVKTGITLEDLAYMENVYSPPIGALNEPIAVAAQNALSQLAS